MDVFGGPGVTFGTAMRPDHCSTKRNIQPIRQTSGHCAASRLHNSLKYFLYLKATLLVSPKQSQQFQS